MPDSEILIQPVEQALDYHDLKREVGSKLNAEQWGFAVPVQIREISQASAAVESASYLQRVQDGIYEILSHARNELGGLFNRSKFLDDLTHLATSEGLRPKTDSSKFGSLQDVGSIARTDLIYEMQVGSAYGYAEWSYGNSADSLDSHPAYELIRVRNSIKKRDWNTRWQEAGQAVGWSGAIEQPHIALKTSPIWRKLSRFDRAFPPFDFNSGMWIEPVRREDAIRFGLIKKGEQLKPDEKPYAEHWETSVADLSQELRESLKEAFPKSVKIVGDTAKWRKPK